MVEQVRQFMEQWNMVQPGDVLIVGLSGGADSMCLCLVLKELSDSMGVTLEAVHVEHGIRGEESERDAAFVRQFCEANGVALTLAHIDVPAYAQSHRLGMEEAARILRYRIFAQNAGAHGPRAKVALAHHREDNAETMLMSLARGSGLDGLCGIRPVRRDAAGVCYIRPLLASGRGEIEAFLKERGQTYCTDSTNSSMEYTRNYIRGEIIPRMEQVNPRAVVHMNRTAAQLMELKEYLDTVVEAEYGHIVHWEAGTGRKEAHLAEKELGALPEVLQKRILLRAAAEVSGTKRDIGTVHVEAVLALFEKQTGRHVELPGGIEADRVYGGVCLHQKRVDEAAAEICVTAEQLQQIRRQGTVLAVPIQGENDFLELKVFSYEGKSEKISKKMYTKWFDYDKMKDGFSVRNRRAGDYFLIDDAGHRKKLSDYFIDEKIPREQRGRMPLVAAGPEVFWLIGGRMGESGRVKARTQTILEISYIQERGS